MKKKILITFVSVLMLLALTFSLAACGSSIAGTYKLEEMSVTSYADGKVYTVKAGEDIVVETGTEHNMEYSVQADDCVFTFKKDGTYSISMKLPQIFATSINMINASSKGTWEEKDGKISTKADSDDDEVDISSTLTIDDDKIVVDMMAELGIKFVLSKQI